MQEPKRTQRQKLYPMGRSKLLVADVSAESRARGGDQAFSTK